MGRAIKSLPAPVVRPRLLAFGLLLAFVVVALDQASKHWLAYLLLDPGLAPLPPRILTLAPFLDLVAVWNRGISFSLLPGVGPWLLSAVALGVSLGLFLWLRRAQSLPVALGIGLVLGGAIGNVIDRVRIGAVFDFLYFHIHDYYWPAFNLADSAITLGVSVLLWDGLFCTTDRAKNGRPGRPD